MWRLRKRLCQYVRLCCCDFGSWMRYLSCGAKLMICKHLSIWWWIIMIVSCARRKGEIVRCCHGFRSAVWEYVLNWTASSPGWRIHVIKQSFNLCCTFNLWMSLLFWSLMTLILMLFVFPLGIFMASVTVVSQCLPGIYGFILRTFLWGKEILSLGFTDWELRERETKVVGVL